MASRGGGRPPGKRGPNKGQQQTGQQPTGQQQQQARPGNVANLTSQMDAVKLGGSDFFYPLRPKRGPNDKAPGNPVELLSNLFKLSIKQDLPIYEYAIEVMIVDLDEKGDTPPGPIIPRKLSSQIRQIALEAAIKKHIKESRTKLVNTEKGAYNYVFDFKISFMYTLFEIFPSDTKTTKEIDVTVNLQQIQDHQIKDVPKTFRVRLSSGKPINLSSSIRSITASGQTCTSEANSIMRAVNTIIRGRIVTIPDFVSTQTNIYNFSDKKKYQFKVGPGVVINEGTFISSKFIEGGLSINIANTVGAFHEEICLTELLKEKFRNINFQNALGKAELDFLNKELLNKQVEARHKNYGNKNVHFRRYRINSIGGSGNDKFNYVDKKTKMAQEITIAQYFKKEYNYNIKYPNLPCVIDKTRKLPIEICHLIDKQRVLRKMTPLETSAIITKTAIPAKEHFEKLKTNVNNLKQLDQPMADFGIQFEPRPISVVGREINSIPLIGAQGELSPSNGQYDARRSRFLKPVKINKWLLTFIVDRFMSEDKQKSPDLGASNFGAKYQDFGKRKGVMIGPCAGTAFIPATQNPFEMKKALKSHFQKLADNNIDHCIFVLPKMDIEYLYRYLQYLEATTRKANNPVTRVSCIKYENYTKKIVFDQRGGEMFIGNLWLKYNTKLGGVNFALKPVAGAPYLNEGCLYVSVDICHPSPNDKLFQSVAAVVGMWDLTSNKMSYCTRLRVQKKMDNQKSTVEKVIEIGYLVGQVLVEYKKKKGKLPTHLIIMRDGVSEGQLDMVLHYELQKIMEDAKKIYTNAKQNLPLITCLVVQKRHKVRFQRVKPFEDHKGVKDYNIQPGTVIDNTVTHPKHHTFYIAPHKAIKGTSRPAHIYVIFDQIRLSEDMAQSMVLALSYLSPRCTKSTAIPTPVNLADLAAERGKNLVVCWTDDNMSSKLSDDERIKRINEEFLARLGDSEYLNTLFYI